jgi:hypothetical protein
MNCGDSLMTKRNSYQSLDGGSIPTSPLQCKIMLCKFGDIEPILKQYHYKGSHIGGGISFIFALSYNNNIIGGAIVGKLRQDKKYSDNGKKNVTEIRRMACIDETPKYIESYFLSKIIWYLKKNTNIDEIISYADMSVGHKGTIYKAANFKLIGETSPSQHVFWKGVRYHPRSLTIDRPYSYKLREAVKTGDAKIEIGKPKLIFSYKINRK